MASPGSIAHRLETQVQQAAPDVHHRPPDGTVDLSELWRILRHRLVAILAVAGILTAATLAYCLVTPRLYTAATQILIDPRDRNVVSNDVNPNAMAPDGGIAQVESQASVIQSTGVLMRAIRATKLTADSEFNGAGFLSRLLGRGPTDTATTDGALTPLEARTLNNLRRRMSVRRADKVFVVDVVVTTRDPDKSAQLANAIAEAYLADQAESRSQAATEASSALTARLAEQRKRVEAAENAVESYRAQHNLVAASGRLISDQQLTEISNQLSAAQARTAMLKSQVEQIAQQRRQGSVAGGSPEAVQSQVVSRLREQEAALVQREADLQSQYGPRYPAIEAVRSQIANLRRLITTEIDRSDQAVRADYERAQSNEKLLAAKLDALTRQTKDADQAMVRLRDLQRDLEAVRAVYASFMLRAQETKEQANLDTSNVRIISQAQPPQQPSWPPTMLLVLGAAVLGLGCGAGFALLREYSSPHLFSIAQAENLIGAPVIGVLKTGQAGATRWPLGAKTSSGPPAGPHAANVAGLALLMLFSDESRRPREARSVLLTSVAADVADRVATVGLLGEAASSQGARVLYIDADAEQDGGEHEPPGLLDVLRGDCTLAAALQRLDGTKDVALLPTGRPHTAQQKMLGRASAARLLADAGNQFDLVVADGGVLSQNVKIAPLIGAVEEIVLVARLYDTPQSDILRVVEAARIMGRSIGGTILLDPQAQA